MKQSVAVSSALNTGDREGNETAGVPYRSEQAEKFRGESVFCDDPHSQLPPPPLEMVHLTNQSSKLTLSCLHFATWRLTRMDAAMF